MVRCVSKGSAMGLGRLYVTFKHEKSAWDMLRDAIQLVGKVGATSGGDILLRKLFTGSGMTRLRVVL